MNDAMTTTVKTKNKLSRLMDAVLAREKEFDAAWKKYGHSHSRDDRHAMMEAHKKAMEAHKAYNDEYNVMNVLRLGKLEGTR